MPTKFSDIYGRAIYKFTDYSFLNSAADSIKEIALQNYLMSAIVDVQHCCSVDLSDYDVENKQFKKQLDSIPFYRSIETLSKKAKHYQG